MTEALSAPSEAGRQKTWAADTILRKYFKVTDERACVLAREALKAETAKFVARMDHRPEPGLRARLVIGFEAGAATALILDDRGALDALDGSLDADGRFVASGGRSRPNAPLSSYSASRLLPVLSRTLCENYKTALADAIRAAGVDAGRPNDAFLFAMTHVARKVIAPRIGARLREFRALLDPEVLAHMNRVADQASDTYRMLTAADANMDPIVSRNRRQACAAYPLATRILLEDRNVRMAIDQGGSVRQALARHFAPVTPDAALAVVDRLRGLNWQMAGRPAYYRPKELFAAIGDIPASWMPRDRRGWTALQRLHVHVGEALLHRGDLAFADCRSRSEIMKRLGPDWPDALAKATRHGGLSGISDMTRSIMRQVLEPQAARHVREAGVQTSWGCTGMLEGVEREFVASFTLKQALEASAAWHARLGALDAGIQAIRNPDAPDGVAWGKACRDWTAGSGISVVMLASERELQEEGVRMDHCVGGYAGACARSSIIVSLRDAAGASLSTAELADDVGKGGRTVLRLVQHNAIGNTRPSAACRRALGDWMRGVERGAIPFDAEGLAEGRSRALTLLRRKQTHDANLTDAQRQDLWSLHRRFMPKPMRSFDTPETWYAASGLKDRLEEKLGRYGRPRDKLSPAAAQARDDEAGLEQAGRALARHDPFEPRRPAPGARCAVDMDISF